MRCLSIALALTAAILVGNVTVAQEPAGVPENIVKELDYLVGTWNAEGKVGDDESTGRFSCRWARLKDRKKVCLIGNWSYTVGGKTEIGANIIGWDAVRKCIEDRGFSDQGGCATLRWTVKSPTEWRGEVHDILDGEEIEAKAEITKKGNSEFVYDAKTSTGETIRWVFRKVATERKSRRAKKEKQ